MLTEQTTEPPLDTLRPSRSRAEVMQAIEDAKDVFVEDSLSRYVVALLRHTRGERAAGARRQPARRDRAAPRRQGARARRGARLRAARGRPGGRRARARAPSDPRARGALRRSRGGGDRARGGRRHARPGLMRAGRARAVLALAAATYLAAWAFGSRPLYPLAVGLALAAVVAWAWTRLAAGPMTLRRRVGQRRAPRGRGRLDHGRARAPLARCRRAR